MFFIPKISFCITCKNRFHQIKNTLGKNLNDNKKFKHLIEFILVDFGSNDGLKKWIITKFNNELQEEYLRYFYTEELSSWHASIAKNTAHLFAKNDILVNLDCDNFTGPNGGKFLIKNFMRYGISNVFHQFSGNFSDGTFGRISLSRLNFNFLGGYNENFDPMGFQDYDLLLRAEELGLKVIQIVNPLYSKAIVNSKNESIVNCETNISYDQMNLNNKILSEFNIGTGNIINSHKYWMIGKEFFNFKDEIFKFRTCNCNNIIK